MDTKQLKPQNLCEHCKLRRKTSSQKNNDAGYNGCAVTLGDHPKNPSSEQEITNGVKTEVLAFGWIKAGNMMVSNQLIVRNVSSCKWRIGR
jgi:hypothetical protein